MRFTLWNWFHCAQTIIVNPFFPMVKSVKNISLCEISFLFDSKRSNCIVLHTPHKGKMTYIQYELGIHKLRNYWAHRKHHIQRWMMSAYGVVHSWSWTLFEPLLRCLWRLVLANESLFHRDFSRGNKCLLDRIPSQVAYHLKRINHL